MDLTTDLICSQLSPVPKWKGSSRVCLINCNSYNTDIFICICICIFFSFLRKRTSRSSSKTLNKLYVFYQTGWRTVAAAADCPNSACNRCVIERVFFLHILCYFTFPLSVVKGCFSYDCAIYLPYSHWICIGNIFARRQKTAHSFFCMVSHVFVTEETSDGISTCEERHISK